LSELFHADVFVKFAAALIALINPLYGVPVFLGMTRNYSPAEKRVTAAVVALTVFFTATITTLTGEEILAFFGISVPAFQIAGGVIILGIGLAMLKDDGRSGGDSKALASGHERERGVAVVPMSIPLTIGPGAIATIVLFAHLLDDGDEIVTMIPVVLGISLLTWLSLLFADPISKALGDTVISVISRIMAILLTAIAVEMVIDGAFQAFEDHSANLSGQSGGGS